MRKPLIILAIIAFLIPFIGASQINPADSLQQTIQTQPLLKLKHLDFNFVNAEDNRTLKLLETGNLTFTWKTDNTEDSFIGIKLKSKNQENWIEKVVPAADTAIVFESLTENLFFDYQIGSGSSEDEIVYNNEIELCHTLSQNIFKNNGAKGKEESVEIFWAIEYGALSEILSYFPDAYYIVQWNTKIGKKQNELNPEKGKWQVKDKIDINKVKIKEKDLVGGEKYIYKIGLVVDGKHIWSKESKFETKRSWGIFKLLVLLGSLGMFIYGMKIMSEGLQKAAGSRLRNMLGSITSNRISGIFTGLGITSIVQSSSVTTVMTVSFVNAGLMNLKQATGVIMGANIGTTMTAWLILLFGFKVDIGAYALILIAFGAPLLFFGKSSVRNWASVIIGFSLLFMGLGFLKDNVPDIGADSPLIQFFVDYKDSGLLGTLMFIGLGTLATVLIQSSSATMALTMTLVGGGVLPFEVAAAMILGENIGTTITAQLAALIGNVHAKRAARIHALFNIIGVIWCVLVFQLFLKGVAYFVDGDPFSNPEDANEGLAIFHSAFNIANVLVLVWFVPKLVKLAEKTVRSRGAIDEEFHLDYIGTGMMGTPDLSILEAKKEVAKFGEITSRMAGFMKKLLVEQNKKAKGKLHEKIAKYEEITDRVEIEVANYLSKVSQGEMTAETAQRVRSMNAIVNDLERIGDIFYQISKTLERKDEQKLYFLPEQRANIFEMLKLVDGAFEIMIDNLNAEWEAVSIEPAQLAEHQINKKRNELRKEHLENMQNPDFNMESGMVFSNIFSSLEKVGDHIINVSEAITGKIN
ncbi:Na/Pi cotransporter family protein [Paracrocinitomix mangrovi]|uniref:Na/Pi cotransporter family protein n=1 Tax=Paracrocinitomix mangrovi TaxID=2862509 RepID=UPI001C8DBFEE|nr:Na/Pi cotransporter family protein [Paracrocinitomix mangrovi]UKN00929.1 Na/Pi cotransporter family protein [Paracrocinitomix mangrovi]